ncbi:MAG: methyltransferase domain-containing protein [Candidatus Marinimicrobia bacterium]|nr:methyltransferase domain-containing protein [Candidatus Neomarinimicrobiota bacterium]MCF7851007.1 methyltransferase domain-containing protein [Candidatus Neomarinimicrobiota bacterium]MCF7904939.1 methyltransferase domain-containing protein [Candidatus Neomarinimicrobiota bacterium]
MSNKIQKIKPYERLARYYDQLMDYIDYATWIREVEDLADQHDAGDKWLDISCGTGSMAIQLARNGKTVTAVDLSQDMVEMAQAKAAEAGLSIDLSVGDMLTFHSTSKYDVIINLHDGLNYLLEDVNTQSFIDNSHDLLEPNGLLIFDVVTPLLCQTHFRGYREILADDEGGYERYTTYDPVTQLAESRFTLNTDQENMVQVESHIQRAYGLKSVESLCLKSQFSWWQILDDETLDAATEKSERLLVLMKK